MYLLLRYTARSFFSVAAMLATLVAQAQSVRWEPASGTLAREQTSVISLVFSDADSKTNPPVPPAADGIEFVGQPGRSEQNSYSIGTGSGNVRRRTVTYNYAVRPTRTDGEVRIPAFAIETDVGKLVVPAAGFTISAATVGDSGLRLDQIADARLEPPAADVWAGEVILLRHVLGVARDRQFRSSKELEWDQTPLLLESWSDEPARGVSATPPPRNTETRTVRALVRDAGALTLPSIRQQVVIATGQDLFGRPVGDQFIITTKPVTLNARPLPAPAPADFSGAIGRFSLTSKIVPERAAVGEPVTWTLSLEGTGNWPMVDRLRPRTVPGEFRVVSPRAQKTPKDGLLFDGTLSEDLVLIPQKSGRYTLGPYTLSIFNPITGAYETLRTTPITVDIAPASASTPPAGPGAPSPAASESVDAAGSVPVLPHATPPAAVAPLPADPLPATAAVRAPFHDWPRLLWFTLAALAAPLAIWLVLAARHARRHDPLRARRQAHARIAELLPRIAAKPDSADLLAWQHAAHDLFELNSATPSARDLPDPIWAALWIETERALYRRSSPLSEAWHAQARDALLRATPPRRSVFSSLRPKHLFARAAGLLLATALASHFLASPASAAEPARPDVDSNRAYIDGDFPAAEKSYRAIVEASPANPAARHNLAIALAQQGKWSEAAAHAYAASMQAPADEAVKRLCAATLPRAGYLPPSIPAGARHLSVANWQTLALVAAVFGLGVAPAAYALALHRIGSRRLLQAIGHATLLVCAIAFAAAWFALRAHGPAIHPDAVLVFNDTKLRAVPTDAGDQKLVTDLPAGTVARVDKSFLGWRRLVLPDGNPGWTRVDSLVGLWSVP